MLAARSYLGWPLCLALLSGVGCGDDGGGGAGEPLTRGDAGKPVPDELDGSVPDDAGDDASDAGEDPEPDFVSECRGDIKEFPAARVSEGQVFASSVFENRLELVYSEPSCGGTRASSSTHGLMHVSLPSSGDFDEPRGLVNLGEACYQTRNPAVVAGASPQFTTAFLSNIAGGTDLYALKSSSSAPTRASDEEDYRLSALTATSLNNKVWVAYALTPLAQPFPPPLTPPGAIRVAELGGSAAASVVEAEEGFHAQRIALSELGGSSDASVAGVVAWVSDARDRQGSYLRFLDAEGNVVGDVTTLSTALGSTPSLSIAKREEGGGAIAYTILSGSQQVRFRTLSPQGELGPEVSLTRGDLDVREFSLVAYATGYALVVRQVSLANNQGSIQAIFLDETGNVGRTRLVTTASSNASGLEAHLALDGRLLVVWSDPETLAGEDATTTTENRIKVARVTCP